MAKKPGKSKPEIKPAQLQQRTARLAELARLAQIFIDGDLLSQLLSEHGRLWTDTDDIDFNYEPFIVLKKTVLRLELVPTDGRGAYIAVWRQRPDIPAEAEPLLFGMKRSGYTTDKITMPKPMRVAITRQRVATEVLPSRALTLFAPLYDSLHHVVGAVEVFDDPAGLNQSP